MSTQIDPIDPAGVMPRKVSVEFLYLDLGTCGRCRGTDESLEQALQLASPVLTAAGIAVDVSKVHVKTEQQAGALGLIASPTIRVDGWDIQPDVLQSPCDDCGDLCGCAGGCMHCRMWSWQGEQHSAAPIGLIVAAMLAAAGHRIALPATAPTADAPENLKRFFGSLHSSRQTACCHGDDDKEPGQ